MAQQLILVRHAQGESQQQGAFIGRTDCPLSAEGRRQAAAARAALAPFAAAPLFCSPRRRAVETAALALPGVAPTILPELAEVDFGRWEGLTFAEIAAADPVAVTAWAEREATFVFPGGEALADFRERVRQAARRLAAVPAPTVLAVSHGGVIRAMLCELLGLPAAAHHAFQLDHGAVAILRLQDGVGVLTRLGPPP